MICFEFPLVERVRMFLRLESLFKRFDCLLNQGHEIAHHFAIQSLFEIMECTARADLKSDMLQEIERQRQQYSLLLSNEEVDQGKLSSLLARLGDISNQLQANHQKFGSHLRENEWLMILKQKISVAGGACEFDFPSYHFWLNSPESKRKEDLLGWFGSYNSTAQSVNELLGLLRNNKAQSSLTAKKGNYQQSGLGERLHMMRIFVDAKLKVIPEVSANKYVTNIRFVRESTIHAKGRQVEVDIPFQLETCRF